MNTTESNVSKKLTMSMMQFKVIKYKKAKGLGGADFLLFIPYTPPFLCFVFMKVYKPKAFKNILCVTGTFSYWQ